MSFQQRHVGEREMLCIRRSQSMGGGSEKEKPYCDGIRKYRFLALAQPIAGMTCFLKPVSAIAGMT